MPNPRDEFATTIGADAVFKGEFRFQKGANLLGQVEGQIKSDGDLVIGEGAKLIGDAAVANLRLDGEVKGNLTATSKVQLSASAKLEGDLQTARLEVAEGAVLVGRCVIGVNGNGQARPATKPTSQPASAVTPAKGRSEAVIKK